MANYVPKILEGPILFEIPKGRVVVDLKKLDLEHMPEKDIPKAWKIVGAKNNKRILVINSERIDAVFQADGTETIKTSGSVGFYNPNERDSVWNLDSYWENISKTNLSAREGLCNINIQELRPSELFFKNYSLRTPVSKDIESPLIIEEYIDTEPESETMPKILIRNKETAVRVTIMVINKSKTNLENIIFVKELPEAFREVMDLKGADGDYKRETDKIFWSGFSLAPNESKSITFGVFLKAETVVPLNTGKISISFATPDTTMSDIIFLGLEGYTKNVTWIDKDEIDNVPGRWNCAIEFENLSTFEIMLREVEVYRQTAEETIFRKRSDRREHLVISEDSLYVTLSPDTENKWTKTFVFPDPKEDPIMEFPSFGQKVDFSVKNNFLRELTGSVVQYGGLVKVADIKVEKSYEVKRINAIEENPIKTTLKACNTGSAPLNDLTFYETIPPGFNIDSIKASLIRESDYQQDITGAVKITEKGGRDLSKERKLILSLSNINKLVAIKAINPKDCVKIDYLLQAVEPEPGVELVVPVSVVGNVLEPFSEHEELRAIAEDKLTVKEHVWRKARVGKSIQEGDTEGEYAITIYYHNKLKPDDEVTLQDITIADILPEGFILVSSSPELTDQRPRLVEGKSFTVLEWSIKNIQPDRMVEIKYTIKGEPGAIYKAKEAQALLTSETLEQTETIEMEEIEKTKKIIVEEQKEIETRTTQPQTPITPPILTNDQEVDSDAISESYQPEKDEGRLKKIRDILKKAGKTLGEIGLKCLPAVGSMLVGMVCPPAAGYIGKLISNKISSFGIKVDETSITENIEEAMKKASFRGIEDLINKKLEEINANIDEDKLKLIIDTSLRPIINGFNKAIDFASKKPFEAIETLRAWMEDEISNISLDVKQELEESINVIINLLESNTEDTKRRLDDVRTNIKNLEKNLDRVVSILSKNISKDLNTENIIFLSKCFLNTVSFSSLFEIAYSDEKYEPRVDAEKAIDEFIEIATLPIGEERKIFLLLSDMGIGKTWLLAHKANELMKTITVKGQIVPLFFSARKNVTKTVQAFFGSIVMLDAFNVLKQMFSTLKEKNANLLVIIDGIDEVERPEFILPLLKDTVMRLATEGVPTIISCRTADWSANEYINRVKHDLNSYIFRGKPSNSIIDKASLILNEFTNDELKTAALKYGLDSSKMSETQLKLAKKPYIMRIFADWQFRFDKIPEVSDSEKLALLIAGSSDIPDELTIFGRGGIRGPIKEVLYDVLEEFIDIQGNIPNKEIFSAKLRPYKENRNAWARICSAGIFREKDTSLGSIVQINEDFVPGLVNLVMKRRKLLGSS